MFQVSRDSNLKIPKQIKKYDKSSNSVEDVVQIKKAVAIANNQKFNENSTRQEVSEEDKNLEIISKIPYNSNDLIVITIVKKLSAYVITVTEKSPKKFRGVFVNRMQNYCIDTLENLLQANYIRIDSINNKLKREELQKQAVVKLKLLGYISLLALNSSCILKKHLKTLKKLKDKNIVDDEYVYIRKKAFYNNIKDTSESIKLKSNVFPNKHKK